MIGIMIGFRMKNVRMKMARMIAPTTPLFTLSEFVMRRLSVWCF